jgi:hypothetical protein
MSSGYTMSTTEGKSRQGVAILSVSRPARWFCLSDTYPLTCPARGTLPVAVLQSSWSLAYAKHVSMLRWRHGKEESGWWAHLQLDSAHLSSE